VKSDELTHRIKELTKKHESKLDLESASDYRKELEYWRLKLGIEEKENRESCKSNIQLVACGIESLSASLDIKGINLTGFASSVQKAMNDGKFKSFVDYYVENIADTSTSHATSPLFSLCSVFGLIILQTNMRQTQGRENRSAQPGFPTDNSETPSFPQTPRGQMPSPKVFCLPPQVKSVFRPLIDNYRQRQEVNDLDTEDELATLERRLGEMDPLNSVIHQDD
jgi:hypothetical protein